MSFPNGIAATFEDTDGLIYTSPLTYDRVNGGRHIQSKFPIFQLPIELFGCFFPYLDNKDLAALALVDRDCRQWARSMQFANVTLDYGPKSSEIFWQLKVETDEQRKFHSSSQIDSVPPVTISSCIRRLIVLGPPAIITKPYPRERLLCPDTAFEALFPCEDAECRERSYFRLLGRIVRQLPNLQVLDWNCSMVMEKGVLNDVLRSNIRHLRLNNIRAGEDDAEVPGLVYTCPRSHLNSQNDGCGDETEEVSLEDGSLPLESLVAGVSWPICGSTAVGDIGPFLSELIRVSAPTLKNLALRDWSPSALASGRVYELAGDLQCLQRLRNVVLDEICVKPLDRLLGPRTSVTSLTVDSLAEHSRRYLVDRGAIPSLEHLHWIYAEDSFPDMMTFLDANRQLTFFAISTAIPADLITTELLPKFASDFHFLTSLNLKWSGATIPEDSLELLAKIHCLKHMWISAGCQAGCRHTWEIDHAALRDALKPLARLETFAVTRDTYSIRVHPLRDPDPAVYYMNQNFPVGVTFADYLNEDEMRDGYLGSGVVRNGLMTRGWERWHRSMMHVEAQKYVECFSKLTWCFIGQICWAVVEEDSNTTQSPPSADKEGTTASSHTCRKAVAEHNGERDPDLKHLHRRWGIVNEFPL
ncbi:hypothetical protein AX16_000848 [Volvariella volvacea WC 439]|nr:hypothetical protein AX16_000848 [Volvariella volvacea WC 439]